MTAKFKNRTYLDSAYVAYYVICTTITRMSYRSNFIHWIHFGDTKTSPTSYMFDTKEFVKNFNELHKLHNSEIGKHVLNYTVSEVVSLLSSPNISFLSNELMDKYRIDIVNSGDDIRVEYLNG